MTHSTTPMSIPYAPPTRPSAPVQRRDPSAWRWVLASVGWTITGAAIVGSIALVIGGPLRSATLTWVAAGAGLLVLGAMAAAVRAARRSHAAAVLAYAEQAVRLNLPLPPVLAAAARSERPGVRAALDRVLRRLELGVPLAGALGDALGGLSRREQGVIEAADRSGRLADALRRLTEAARRPVERDPSAGVFLRWYPLVLGPVFLAAVSFYLIYVMPKVVQLYADFGLRPTPAMEFFRGAYEWLAVLVLVAATVVLAYVSRSAGVLLAPRLSRYNPARRLTDAVAWRVPLLGTPARHRAYADLFDALADAVETGHTFPAALAGASQLRTNAVFERQVERWGVAAASGLPPADAARAAGLPALAVGLLASARRGDDVAKVLRFLARYHDSQFGRAAEVVRAVVMPAMALAFGALVALFALAVFGPMVQLMDVAGLPIGPRVRM